MQRIAVVLVIGLAAAGAWAADEAQVLRQRAEQLASQDRCDEAIPRAQQARSLDPKDARAALVEGRCLLRLNRYEAALAPLQAARELDPTLPGVHTDLAQAHYHLEEFDAAAESLDRAERQNPDDARMHLYRGLVLLRDARDEEAANAFERAGSLDPSLSEVAGLYAGRTWAGMRDRERAAAAFARARSADPGSEWAQAASRELERLEGPYQSNTWARLRGGIEFDDNVALRVSGNQDAFNIQRLGVFDFDEDEDVRGVFEGELGHEFLRSPDQSLGLMAGYQGNAHVDEHAFDLQYPWASAWYDRRIGEETWLRLQPFGGYAWLETDPFVLHGGGVASLSHPLAKQLTGRLYGQINYNDYKYRIRPDPVLVAIDATRNGVTPNSSTLNPQARRRRDRDGWQTDAGGELIYQLAETETTLRAGTGYERYEAQGRDWSRHGSRSWVALYQPLPLDFVLELEGSFSYHPYDHRSSFLRAVLFANGLGPKRLDKIWEAKAELGYRLTDYLLISGRYSYYDNDSNTRLFDYDRHIVGGYLTLSWEG